MRIIGIDPTEAYANEAFEPGSLGMDDASNIYMFINPSAAIDQYDAVEISTDGAGAPTDVSGARGTRVGVAPVALTAAQFGWVQVYGVAQVNALSSAAANVQLYTSATDGHVEDADTSNTPDIILGMVLTTARAASNGPAPCLLNWPEIGA